MLQSAAGFALLLGLNKLTDTFVEQLKSIVQGTGIKLTCSKTTEEAKQALNQLQFSSGSRGGPREPCPPGPVKIGHRFHVSRPPPLPGRWIRYCNYLISHK